MKQMVLPFACVALLLCVGCESSERREAHSVVTAIGRFRTADHATTPGLVEALRATPCSVPEVCRARDTCVAAGEATSKALILKAEVEKGIVRLDKGEFTKDSPEAKLLATKLEEAEALLKKGHDSLPECDEQVQALKRKHHF